MKKWFVLLLMLLPFQVALASGSQPSDASVKELIKVMHARHTLDRVTSQMDRIMKLSMQRALGKQHFNAKQQKILDNMETRMAALLKSDLKWKSVEPDIIQIYQKSFTQQDVNSMIAFYKTPAGKAVVAKMPLVMQNTTRIMRQRMARIMPQIRQLAMDTTKQLKAAGASNAK